MLGWSITVGIVLVGITIVLIIEFLRPLLCVMMCPDLVVLVHPVRLGQLVDLTADESGKQLLSESVLDDIT